MNAPDNLADKYKAFFYKSDAGQFFVQQLMAVIDRNVGKAMDTNSLDHLSRAKGNREVVDLFDNVITNGDSKKK